MFPTFTASGTFRGQTREWTLEVRDGTLEFWDAMREDAEQWRFAVWHPIHARGVAAWTQAALEALWRDALERGNVGRRIEMSDELTIFLRERNRGFLRFKRESRTIKHETHVYEPDLFGRGIGELKQSLESSALSCYEGDFGTELYDLGIPFAFNPQGCMGLNNRELHLSYARGDERELEMLNEWAWKLDTWWIERVMAQSKVEGFALQVIARPDEPAKAVFGGFDKNWGLRDVEHPRVALWSELLRFFEPSPDETAHRRDLNAGTRLFSFCLGPHPDWDYFNYSTGRVIRYSAHEELELRLPLRDWLRNRAGLSDERIAELLF